MTDRNSLTQGLPLRALKVKLPVLYRICAKISKVRNIRENRG